MKKLDELIKTRADKLDLGREDTLMAAQDILNQLYPGRLRARNLKEGLLTVTTPSAAVANDVRLSQVKILKKLKNLNIITIKISIG